MTVTKIKYTHQDKGMIRYNYVTNEDEKNMFRRGRNRAMNNVFAKYGLPKNMADKEIKQRVKHYNWVVGKLVKRGQVSEKLVKRGQVSDNRRINKLTKFLMNDTVFTEKKRKDIVDLAINQLNGIRQDDNAILALRSPVVVSYLMELVYLFGRPGAYQFTGEIKASGRFREDAAMVAVLKKRIHFLRRLKKIKTNHGGVGLVTIPTNLKEKYNLPSIYNPTTGSARLRFNHAEIKKIFDIIFPLPPQKRKRSPQTGY